MKIQKRNEKEVEIGLVSQEGEIMGSPETQVVRVREAGAAPVRAVQREMKANVGTDEDEEKVAVVRLRRTVQEMTERKSANGKENETEVKRKRGSVEIAARFEVTVYMHLGHRQ